MKKITFIILSLLLALPALANTVAFGTPAYITGATSATTSLLTVSPGVTRTITLDSFANGSGQKSSEGYLLYTQVASTSASQSGITVDYSQNGQEWFTNNLATTSAAKIGILGSAPSYSLLGNAVSSTTRVAIKVETPTRFTRITFSSLVGTSTAWAMFLPIVTY